MGGGCFNNVLFIVHDASAERFLAKIITNMFSSGQISKCANVTITLNQKPSSEISILRVSKPDLV